MQWGITNWLVEITKLFFCSVLTVNQLSDPPVHVELSPVHVKSSWHHPHTPSVITHSLHLWTESNRYDISKLKYIYNVIYFDFLILWETKIIDSI